MFDFWKNEKGSGGCGVRAQRAIEPDCSPIQTSGVAIPSGVKLSNHSSPKIAIKLCRNLKLQQRLREVYWVEKSAICAKV
jgi:hypothetical protein